MISFKRLIDLRTAIKSKLKNSSALNAEALDSEQQALKILANSTSYGIFVELIVADLDAPEKLTCYGPSGEGFSVESMKIEEPGRYFHPLLATLITGAARLMLAIAERLCVAKGLDWAFCDTDSMAIAKPDDMDEAEFFERAQSICDWFSPLNPYEKKGLDIQNRRRELSNCGVRRRIEIRAALLLLHLREALCPIQSSESPAKSSFARPPRMGWGNTSRPMKPMTRRIQFPRRQSP